MKTILIALLLMVLGALALWGCPTKRYIPDPGPPQPETQADYIRLEETPGYLGREPYVGPKVQFYRMLAHKKSPQIAAGFLVSSIEMKYYFTVPL